MYQHGRDCGDPCKNSFRVEGKEAPCDTCYPVTLPQNQEAVRVYSLVSHQVRTAGMGEIISLDYNAVAWIMDLLNVRNKLDCLERVNTIFAEMQDMRANK